MSYKFKEIWCNKGNFTESNRKSSEIDTLVIHYTGNNGDTAENNGNYFKNNVVKLQVQQQNAQARHLKM